MSFLLSEAPSVAGGPSTASFCQPLADADVDPVVRHTQQDLLDLVVEHFDLHAVRIELADGTTSVDGDPALSRVDLAQIDDECLSPQSRQMAEVRAAQPDAAWIVWRGDPYWVLSAPVLCEDTRARLASLVIMIRDASVEPRNLADQLRELTSLASVLIHSRLGPQLPEDELRTTQRLPSLVNCRTPAEFGYLLTNRLCNELRCEQVALGQVRRSRVELLAISGCTHFKASSPGVVQMRQAMEECLDCESPVGFPSLEAGTLFPIHQQWSTSSGGSCTYSLPLQVADRTIAVLSLRRRASRPLAEADLTHLREGLSSVTPLLELLQRASRSLPAHTAACVEQGFRGRRAILRVLILLFLTLGCSWLCLGTVVYQPLCEATVVSARLLHVSAPFESRLERAHVRAGDHVREGEPLVEFETYSLQLALASIRAEIDRAQIDVSRAIEEGKVALSALHKAQVRVLRTQEAALERKIEQAVIRAPMDGTIVESHFDRRMGQVFTLGEPVLEFAPADGWELEVQVPEAIITMIEPEQTGTFLSASSSHESLPFRIRQMNGSAEVIDASNVYVSRGELQSEPPWLRSGMRGVARISTSRQPVLWVAFRKLIDWTRLRFWI